MDLKRANKIYERILNETKTIRLNNEKKSQLIGKFGKNILLLRQICNIEVKIADDFACIDDKSNIVTLTPIIGNSEDGTVINQYMFTDSTWAAKVQRYVKSATRGGFIKWIPHDEMQELDGVCMDELNRKLFEIACKYNVEIITHEIIVDTIYHCICILENQGSSYLEIAIQKAATVIHERHRPKWEKQVIRKCKWREKKKRYVVNL